MYATSFGSLNSEPMPAWTKGFSRQRSVTGIFTSAPGRTLAAASVLLEVELVELVQVEVIRGDGDRGEEVDAELAVLHRLEPVRDREADDRRDRGTDLVEAGSE